LNGLAHLFRLLLASSFLVLGFPWRASGAAHPKRYVPDVLFVRSVVETCLAEKFASVPLSPGDTLFVRPDAENEKNWLLEDVLTRLALESGIHVKRPGDSPGCVQQRCYTFSFGLVDLALNSFAEHRGLFRRAMTTREVKFRVFLSMADHTGTVLWTSWGQATQAETFPSQKDRGLESPDFLKRNVIQSEDKLTELVVIGGVVTSLAYLLF